MNRLNMSLLVLIPMLLGLGFWGFRQLKTQSSASNLPSRQELMRRSENRTAALLVYASQNTETAEAYKQMALNIVNESRWFDIEMKADRDVKVGDMANRRVYLIGTPSSNSWIKEIMPKLPVSFEEKAFQVWENRYSDPNDILQLLYPNPLHQNMPLFVISGNSDAAILAHQSIEVRGDYQVVRHRKAQLFGLFDQKPENRWQFDPLNHRNLAFSSKPNIETEHYKFFSTSKEIDATEMKQISDKRELIYGMIRQFLGEMKPHPKVNYYLFSTFEDKGLATGNVVCSSNGLRLPERRRGRRAPVVAVDTFSVNAIENPIYHCNDGVAEAQLLLQHQLGKPKMNALETGLAMYFSDHWGDEGYEFWANRLHNANAAPKLAEILSNEFFDTESNLMNPAMAGSFVAFLIQKFGNTAFLAQYKTWNANDLLTFESEWEAYLEAQTPNFTAKIAENKVKFPQPLDFQKGFNFAHEGYQIYNGYISQQAAESVEYMQKMNVDSYAVIPYTFMRDPKKPTPFSLAHGADDENDESMIFLGKVAEQKGMTAMLKPQVWIPNSWPGDVEMASEADWKLFFAYYERWILHYALLAEMHQIPILCAATEFGKATKGHEDEWMKIFAKIRKVYSGKLTVAAHWEGGFEHQAFWEALDFMGINTYKQLSDKENPTDAELQKGANEAAALFEQVATKYNKPIIFTEVGFTATKAPWQKPWEYADGKKPFMEDQKRCYEALFRAMHERAKGKSWFKGFYWWKFPSFLDYGGTDDPDFTPNGKPAENTVREWFGKTW